MGGGEGGGEAKIKIEQKKQQLVEVELLLQVYYQEEGQRRQFAPGPQCKGGPQIWKIKKIIWNVFLYK
jgi:hypothetical protein